MTMKKLSGMLDSTELIIPATRYYLGRMTIAACSHAEALAAQWDRLSEHTKSILMRDIEDAFNDDDRDRLEGSRYRRLGMDMDRVAWEKVRVKWYATKYDGHGDEDDD